MRSLFLYHKSRKKEHMYNPYQQNLIQQKALIEQQLNQMQMPPININQYSQPTPANYDFNGRYISSYEEAKNLSSSNLPLILFDRNSPLFYMKDATGELKKYKFEEVPNEPIQSDLEKKVNLLAEQVNSLVNVLYSAQKGNCDESTNE